MLQKIPVAFLKDMYFGDSGEKIDIAMGWKLYLEQYHLDITWNEHEK